MLAITKSHWRSIVGATVAIGLTAAIPAIATAPMPPQLVLSKLNGKPVNILYLTRSSDKVLVRCYPGLQPSVVVKKNADGTKEGTLTCKN
jgi:hypothetical protein